MGEPFGLGRARRVPLRAVARETGARFRHGRITGVDDHARLVLLDDDDPLPYDMVLLAPGAGPSIVHPAATAWRDDDPPTWPGLRVRPARARFGASSSWCRPARPGCCPPTSSRSCSRDRRPVRSRSRSSPARSALGGIEPTASSGVAIELQRAGVRVLTGVHAEVLAGRRPTVVLHPGGRSLQPDRIITIPRLEGRRLPGVPADRGRVHPGRRPLRRGRAAPRVGRRRRHRLPAQARRPRRRTGRGRRCRDRRAGRRRADPRSWRPVLRGVLATGAGALVLRSPRRAATGAGRPGRNRCRRAGQGRGPALSPTWRGTAPRGRVHRALLRPPRASDAVGGVPRLRRRHARPGRRCRAWRGHPRAGRMRWRGRAHGWCGART